MLVLLAAVLLIVLSGHAPRRPGAVLLLAVGIPAIAALTIVIARKWRRARTVRA